MPETVSASTNETKKLSADTDITFSSDGNIWIKDELHDTEINSIIAVQVEDLITPNMIFNNSEQACGSTGSNAHIYAGNTTVNHTAIAVDLDLSRT
jgi:hypothetical protein